MADTKRSIPKEAENKTSSCVLFSSSLVYGDCFDIKPKAKDMLLSTKMKLMFFKLTSNEGAQIDINRLVIKWQPYVEPTVDSTLRLSLKYDNSDNITSLDDRSVMMNVIGRMSEVHQITWFPTKPLVYSKGVTIKIPWSVDVDTSDVEQNSGSAALGSVKIWCHMDVGPHRPNRRMQTRPYHPPSVEWSNMNFPYYLPIWSVQNIRGVNISGFRGTLQYKMYRDEVLMHQADTSEDNDNILPAMMSLSYQDVGIIKEFTSKCLLSSGGTYCNCKSGLDKYMKEATLNRDHKLDTFQKTVKQYCDNAANGRYQSVPHLDGVYF